MDQNLAYKATRAARELVAQGRRPVYEVRYANVRDGGVTVTVPALPGVRLRCTGRKGVEAAARWRIALELDIPEDAFDISVERA